MSQGHSSYSKKVWQDGLNVKGSHRVMYVDTRSPAGGTVLRGYRMSGDMGLRLLGAGCGQMSLKIMFDLVSNPSCSAPYLVLT